MSDLAERFRREGMADAVVILVAKRIHPTTTAEEWGRALGLQQHEVIAAIARFRAEHTPGGLRPARLRVVDGRKPHGNAGRKMLSLDERRARDERIVWLREHDGMALRDIATEMDLTTSRVQQILRKMAG